MFHTLKSRSQLVDNLASRFQDGFKKKYKDIFQSMATVQYFSNELYQVFF